MKLNAVQRIWVIMLTCAILLSAIPAGAAEDDQTGFYIARFTGLGGDIAAQRIPLGASVSDVVLPEEIGATLYNGISEKHESIPVEEWDDDGFDGDISGLYIFTASISGEWDVGDGVAMPEISVIVAEPETQEILEIEDITGAFSRQVTVDESMRGMGAGWSEEGTTENGDALENTLPYAYKLWGILRNIEDGDTAPNSMDFEESARYSINLPENYSDEDIEEAIDSLLNDFIMNEVIQPAFDAHWLDYPSLATLGADIGLDIAYVISGDAVAITGIDFTFSYITIMPIMPLASNDEAELYINDSTVANYTGTLKEIVNELAKSEHTSSDKYTIKLNGDVTYPKDQTGTGTTVSPFSIAKPFTLDGNGHTLQFTLQNGETVANTYFNLAGDIELRNIVLRKFGNVQGDPFGGDTDDPIGFVCNLYSVKLDNVSSYGYTDNDAINRGLSFTGADTVTIKDTFWITGITANRVIVEEASRIYNGTELTNGPHGIEVGTKISTIVSGSIRPVGAGSLILELKDGAVLAVRVKGATGTLGITASEIYLDGDAEIMHAWATPIIDNISSLIRFTGGTDGNRITGSGNLTLTTTAERDVYTNIIMMPSASDLLTVEELNKIILGEKYDQLYSLKSRVDSGYNYYYLYKTRVLVTYKAGDTTYQFDSPSFARAVDFIDNELGTETDIQIRLRADLPDPMFDPGSEDDSGGLAEDTSTLPNKPVTITSDKLIGGEPFKLGAYDGVGGTTFIANNSVAFESIALSGATISGSGASATVTHGAASLDMNGKSVTIGGGVISEKITVTGTASASSLIISENAELVAINTAGSVTVNANKALTVGNSGIIASSMVLQSASAVQSGGNIGTSTLTLSANAVASSSGNISASTELSLAAGSKLSTGTYVSAKKITSDGGEIEYTGLLGTAAGSYFVDIGDDGIANGSTLNLTLKNAFAPLPPAKYPVVRTPKDAESPIYKINVNFANFSEYTLAGDVALSDASNDYYSMMPVVATLGYDNLIEPERFISFADAVARRNSLTDTITKAKITLWVDITGVANTGLPTYPTTISGDHGSSFKSLTLNSNILEIQSDTGFEKITVRGTAASLFLRAYNGTTPRTLTIGEGADFGTVGSVAGLTSGTGSGLNVTVASGDEFAVADHISGFSQASFKGNISAEEIRDIGTINLNGTDITLKRISNFATLKSASGTNSLIFNENGFTDWRISLFDGTNTGAIDITESKINILTASDYEPAIGDKLLRISESAGEVPYTSYFDFDGGGYADFALRRTPGDATYDYYALTNRVHSLGITRTAPSSGTSDVVYGTSLTYDVKMYDVNGNFINDRFDDASDLPQIAVTINGTAYTGTITTDQLNKKFTFTIPKLGAGTSTITANLTRDPFFLGGENATGTYTQAVSKRGLNMVFEDDSVIAGILKSREYNATQAVVYENGKSVADALKFQPIGTNTGLLTGDVVGINSSSCSLQFTTRHVEANKSVELTGTPTLTGTAAANYELNNMTGTSGALGAKISAKPIVANDLNITIEKTYDGTRLYNYTDPIPTKNDGIYAIDTAEARLTGAFMFEDADAGTNKRVDVTLSMDGTYKDNYSISATPIELRGTIKPKELRLDSITLSEAIQKVYDDDVSIDLSQYQGQMTVNFSGLVNPENFDLILDGAKYLDSDASDIDSGSIAGGFIYKKDKQVEFTFRLPVTGETGYNVAKNYILPVTKKTENNVGTIEKLPVKVTQITDPVEVLKIDAENGVSLTWTPALDRDFEYMHGGSKASGVPGREVEYSIISIDPDPGFFLAAPLPSFNGTNTMTYMADPDLFDLIPPSATVRVSIITQNYYTYYTNMPDNGYCDVAFEGVDKIKVNISGISVEQPKTYDGAAAVISQNPIFTLASGGTDVTGDFNGHQQDVYTFVYIDRNDTSAAPFSEPPTDAGDYILNVSASNDKYSGASGPIYFTISQKDLIITPKNKTIFIDENYPEWRWNSDDNSSDFEIVGLVNGETLADIGLMNGTDPAIVDDDVYISPQSYMSQLQQGEPGTATVALSAALNSRNYDITTETGTFTVKRREIGSGADNMAIIFDPPSPDGENGWYISPIVVKPALSNDKYKFIGSSNANPFALLLMFDEGKYEGVAFYLSTAANGGFATAASELYNMKVDKTPPKINGVSVDQQVKGSPYVVISVDASDATSGINPDEIYAGLNGNKYKLVWEGTEYVAKLPESGTYTIYVKDYAGHEASTSIYVDVKVLTGIYVTEKNDPHRQHVSLVNCVIADGGFKLEASEEIGSTAFPGIDFDFEWESSDTSIATVDSDGNVQLQGVVGNTVITVSAMGKSETVLIRVTSGSGNVLNDFSVERNGVVVTTIELELGEILQLTAVPSPDSTAIPGTDFAFRWKMLDPAVASTDQDGLVEALTLGTSILEVDALGIKKQVVINVVTAHTAVITGIKIKRGNDFITSLPLKDSDVPVQLEAVPDDGSTAIAGTHFSFDWSVDDTSIVTVDQQGNVTPVAVGNTKLTVEAMNKKAELYILVSMDSTGVLNGIIVKRDGVEISHTNLSLIDGAVTLTAEQAAGSTTVPGVDFHWLWESKDAGIATVNQQGVVTPIAIGNTEITVSALDKSKSATVTLSVISGRDGVLTGIVVKQDNTPVDYVKAKLPGLPVQLTAEPTVGSTLIPGVDFGWSWNILDDYIASVDRNGLLTPKMIGDTVLTVSAMGMSTKVLIRVYYELPIGGSIDPDNPPGFDAPSGSIPPGVDQADIRLIIEPLDDAPKQSMKSDIVNRANSAFAPYLYYSDWAENAQWLEIRMMNISTNEEIKPAGPVDICIPYAWSVGREDAPFMLLHKIGSSIDMVPVSTGDTSYMFTVDTLSPFAFLWKGTVSGGPMDPGTNTGNTGWSSGSSDDSGKGSYDFWQWVKTMVLTADKKGTVRVRIPKLITTCPSYVLNAVIRRNVNLILIWSGGTIYLNGNKIHKPEKLLYTLEELAAMYGLRNSQDFTNPNMGGDDDIEVFTKNGDLQFIVQDTSVPVKSGTVTKVVRDASSSLAVAEVPVAAADLADGLTMPLPTMHTVLKVMAYMAMILLLSIMLLFCMIIWRRKSR